MPECKRLQIHLVYKSDIYRQRKEELSQKREKYGFCIRRQVGDGRINVTVCMKEKARERERHYTGNYSYL